ncbi:MAG TPA: GntR family transcriptional regulator [Burkholderiaceae bacterium]|nr:GntR family transcriptional regulator [Burkholderiaceae bacterium]
MSRASGEPLYLQLASLLAQRISSGTLRPGDRLPTEPQLIAEHGVSRITVRQAIGLLARNGQVVTRRGKGTFVAMPMRQHRLDELRGFYDALKAQGLEPETALLEFGPASRRTNKRLPDGLDFPVHLRRLYSLDKQAFALVEAWLPQGAAMLDEARVARLTVYQIVERFLGERVASADVAIRCESASPEVARQLGLPPRSPVLVMERKSMTLAGRAIEFMRIHIVPERYEFKLRMPGPLEITGSLQQSRRFPSRVD